MDQRTIDQVDERIRALADPNGTDAALLATLPNTYVKFTDINGNPLPPGHVVQIRLTADLSDIDNIVAVTQ